MKEQRSAVSLAVGCAFGTIWLVCMPCLHARDLELRRDALDALRRAIDFFRSEVADEGGYVYKYAADLSVRQGEGKGGPTEVTVQPPATPSVGFAYLEAYEVVRDPRYLEASRETAQVLIRGQLRSGGWHYRIELDPRRRPLHNYRVNSTPGGANTTVLDDRTTQRAFQFLMRIDQLLGFQDEAIHEAVEYGLAQLTKAQFPNGAWPQRYDGTAPSPRSAVLRASYPEVWSRTYQGASYWSHYTFNDRAIPATITLFLEAAQVYDRAEYASTAEKAGDFILLAQMPEPQPAWAQQYDAAMHPAWARRFEPPAISGRESQTVLETLLLLYRRTGEERFLEPLPRALAYLRRCELPSGRIPRFNELRTNRPLYFTHDYELTYDDGDMPEHYDFKVTSRLDGIEAQYAALRARGPHALPRRDERLDGQAWRRFERQVRRTIDTLDDRGRWVRLGRFKRGGERQPIVFTKAFVDNVGILCEYLRATASVDSLREEAGKHPLPERSETGSSG